MDFNSIKSDECKCYACVGCCGTFTLGGLIGLIVLLCSITSLGPKEQVVVTGPQGKYVINGPQTTIVSPSRKKEHREATRLAPLQYAIVKNSRSGEIRHEVPTENLLWLGAYDEIESINEMVVLKMKQYIRLIAALTGEERVIQGPQTIVPRELEDSPNGTEDAIELGADLAVLTLNKTNGKKQLFQNASGGGLFVPAPYEVILEVRRATLLNPRQYAVVKELLSGQFRHEVGPKLFQPDAYDQVVEVKSMLILENDQYVRLTDERDGTERIERGPKTIVPRPTEVYPEGVKRAINLDTNTAVLVSNRTSGQERLITATGVFFPTPDEDIIETRHLIKVSAHEVVVVRDDKGVVTIHTGSAQRSISFFLPAYSQIVEQTWSSYAEAPPPGPSVQQSKQVKMTTIDTRERKMFFKYEVRTNDNVRISLEGTIFWRVRNVGLMINTTGDPEGDIWHHARSALIQGVSKADLQQFQLNFNNITMDAFNEQAHDGFYDNRGVELNSMELTSWDCADESVSTILQQIIQEKTNRINRLQAQKSQNEVAAASLSAEIQLEMQKTDLIRTQAENKRLEAQMQGEAAGMSLMRAADTFVGGLADTVPNVTSRLDLYRLHETLNSKNLDTKNLATGNAQLYLTPDNVDLRLTMPNDHAPASSAPSPAAAPRLLAEGRETSEEGAQEL